MIFAIDSPLQPCVQQLPISELTSCIIPSPYPASFFARELLDKMTAKVAVPAAKAAVAAAPAVGGVPIAFRVFPKLGTFTRFQPRRYRDLPIGNKSRVNNVGAQRSLQHLYHDLGVLVWEGCNESQIAQIGSILKQVIGMGGPGRIITYIREPSLLVATRYGELKGLRVHEAIDKQRTGLITPVSLVAIATAKLRKILKEKQDLIPLDSVQRIPLETQVVIPGSPPARGIINPTVLNPAYQAPLESFCALRTDGTFGRLLASVNLYTIGAAEYVGRVEVSYTILQKTPDAEVARPVWGNRVVQEGMMDREDARREAISLVASQLLRPLWQLEQEIWAHRAVEAEAKLVEEGLAREAKAQEVKALRLLEAREVQTAKQERKLQMIAENEEQLLERLATNRKYAEERRYRRRQSRNTLPPRSPRSNPNRFE
ncbi:hypothetical protein HJFPF1_07725 [Paramyrothecium foliicola]|nr:hypothetical protein HJFPF1_07725 [Paramyrothecium foliicola]